MLLPPIVTTDLANGVTTHATLLSFFLSLFLSLILSLSHSFSHPFPTCTTSSACHNHSYLSPSTHDFASFHYSSVTSLFVYPTMTSETPDFIYHP